MLLQFWNIPARPFRPTEISLLETHLLAQGRYRNQMLIIAGPKVGHRITVLLTWTLGQVMGTDGNIVWDVTVPRARREN